MIVFENWQTFEFNERNPANYVVGFENGGKFIPFYVGQTSNITCRSADYIRAQFQAPTDFVVGMAIRFLQERGLRVILKYEKGSADKKEREQKETRQEAELKAQGFRLLNGWGFSRLTADKLEETAKIREFVESIARET